MHPLQLLFCLLLLLLVLVLWLLLRLVLLELKLQQHLQHCWVAFSCCYCEGGTSFIIFGSGVCPGS
jgi:hypothetical protein